MNVSLLSMPDSFEHMPAIAIRMPNGALASLAGNVDPHHRVAIADLVLAQSSVRRTIERLMREIEPDVVGLSIMTFQRSTALKIFFTSLRTSAGMQRISPISFAAEISDFASRPQMTTRAPAW